jgi:tol-pal system protein YbgF
MAKRLLFILLLGSASVATGASLNERVERLERILQNQSLSEIVLQIQRLQEEVQRLRGEMEMQRHALDAANRRQRELYMDIDRRLDPDAAGAPVDPGVTPPVAPPVAPPAVEPPVAQPVAPLDTGAPGAAAVPPEPAEEEAAYQQAFDLLQGGSYIESISAFRGFLASYPASGLAGNAQYWLGEASYVTRDFDTAMGDFTQVLDAYPRSSKVPGAMLKIGFIHYEKRQWTKARDMLGRLVQEHPGSTEARLAEQRLERMRKEGR